MSHWLIYHLTFLVTVGAGLMAGVYFAFSAFVMQSLNQLDNESAADAMNAINRIILRSGFLPLFFISSAIYLILLLVAMSDSSIVGRWLLISASVFYLVGMFLCTVLFNVPLNNQLANSSNNPIQKNKTWNHYMTYWTRWNHVRTVCSLMSMTLSLSFLIFSDFRAVL